MKFNRNAALFALTALAAPAAWAHPGHGATGFAAGLAHSLTGIDHVLALLAIGIWAARRQHTTPWRIAACIVVATAAGAIAASAGLTLPGAEPMLAASLIVLGLSVAARAPMPHAAGVAMIVFFTFYHGQAHAAGAVGTALGAYIAGMLLASVVLQSMGHRIGLALQERLLPWIGTAITAAGALQLAYA